MQPTLFVSSKLIADFNERLSGILVRAPRKPAFLEFTPDNFFIATGTNQRAASVSGERR